MKRHRPLLAGISIERIYGMKGTLCCFVRGKTNKKNYLLSCNHVLNGRARLGDSVIQPAMSRSINKVAGFEKAIPLKSVGNLVDAAIAAIKADVRFRNSLPEHGTIKGIATAERNMGVRIIGAYTQTYGTVRETHWNEEVHFNGGMRKKEFKSQLLIETDELLREGDSGAPVLTKKDNKLVGLFFAGRVRDDGTKEALANKIQEVLKGLQVEVVFPRVEA